MSTHPSVPTVKLGRTGLDVSRLALGCLSFGEPGAGKHPWTLDLDAARPLVRHALEHGIQFFDTADSYSNGTSEEILGRLLRELANRDEVVIATKAFFTAHRGERPLGRDERGLSRKALFTAVEGSLRRLGVDTIDLYQIHRWDDATPIEETMEALHDLVKMGKVRHLGASSMHAWQFAKAQEIARRNGWTPFVSMQDHLNLLYREEEREMLPLCADQGVAIVPWSPLARGRLARPAGTSTARSRTDVYGARLSRGLDDLDKPVIDAVEKLAAQRGVPMAQVALAWLLHKPEVTAPIVGISSKAHLDDALAAVHLELSDAEIARLEAPYRPHPVRGFV